MDTGTSVRHVRRRTGPLVRSPARMRWLRMFLQIALMLDPRAWIVRLKMQREAQDRRLKARHDKAKTAVAHLERQFQALKANQKQAMNDLVRRHERDRAVLLDTCETFCTSTETIAAAIDDQDDRFSEEIDDLYDQQMQSRDALRLKIDRRRIALNALQIYTKRRRSIIWYSNLIHRFQTIMSRGTDGSDEGSKVRFASEAKKYDGLKPPHAALDEIVWQFFTQKLQSVEDVYDYVASDQLLLSEVYQLVCQCRTRAMLAQGRPVNVLPGGSETGHMSMVKSPAHNDALEFLGQLLFQAHKRLVSAAELATRRFGSIGAERSAFILHLVRHPDELERLVAAGSADSAKESW